MVQGQNRELPCQISQPLLRFSLSRSGTHARLRQHANPIFPPGRGGPRRRHQDPPRIIPARQGKASLHLVCLGPVPEGMGVVGSVGQYLQDQCFLLLSPPVVPMWPVPARARINIRIRPTLRLHQRPLRLLGVNSTTVTSVP